MKLKAAALAALFAVILIVGACTQQDVQDSGASASGQAVAPPTGDQVELRFVFSKGDTHRETYIMDRTIEQKLPERTVKMEQRTEMTMRFDVQRVNSDGSAQIKVTYESVAVKQDGPEGSLNYDSGNPPAPIHMPDKAKPFAALVGEGFGMRLSHAGEIEKITGVDALINAVVATVPEGRRRQAAAAARKQFGPETMKRMMNVALGYCPRRPVAPGDTWRDRYSVSVPYPVIAENTYTLKKVSGNELHIDLSTTFRPNPDADPIRRPGATMRVTMNGSQQGTIVVDQNTGWLIQADIDQKISGTSKLQSTSNPDKVLEWPVNVTGDYIIRTPRQ